MVRRMIQSQADNNIDETVLFTLCSVIEKESLLKDIFIFGAYFAIYSKLVVGNPMIIYLVLNQEAEANIVDLRNLCVTF